jgi:hypothetical protein
MIVRSDLTLTNSNGAETPTPLNISSAEDALRRLQRNWPREPGVASPLGELLLRKSLDSSGGLLGNDSPTIERLADCSIGHRESSKRRATAAARKPEQLATKAITAIEEATSAMKTDEADHLTRLHAVKRYIELLELAESGKCARRGRGCEAAAARYGGYHKKDHPKR